MPWSVSENHPDCPADTPFAVVKEADGSVEGCHATLEDAESQVAALYAAEENGTESMAAATAPWEGVLAPEGITSGDGREFAPDALTWAELPVSLRWNKEDSHGGAPHTVTVNVGRIDRIWREGSKIWGSGVIDLGDDDGRNAHRKVKNGSLRGVSIDADSIANPDIEYVWPESAEQQAEEDPLSLLFAQPEKVIYHGGRIRAATLVDIPAFVEAYVALTASVAGATFGAVASHDTATSDAEWDGPANEARLTSPLTVATARDAYAWTDDERVEDGTVPKDACSFIHHEVSEDGTPGAANLTACSSGIGVLNGARGGTVIPGADLQGVYDHLAAHLRDAGKEPPEGTFGAPAAVVAHAAPEWKPPVAWFSDPRLSVPTPITVSGEGRLYGHAARWGECHIGQTGVCVSPPHETDHPYFLTGAVTLFDDTEVSVGQITVGTSHAPLNLGAAPASQHYDHTGWAVADVVVGNDDIGIWVAGAIRPNAEPMRVHELKAAGQVSGDWRRIGGQLRLVGLLAVNVPGFPVPKMRARVTAGVQHALVAAGRLNVGMVLSEEEQDTAAMRRVLNLLRSKVHQGR